MNAPGTPLSPETLDELLSADLDGELDRAAADLGLTLDAAVAVIDASPDAPRRRAELTRARDMLAVPIPLAPEQELHLVAGALQGPVDELRAARERRTRAWRVLVAVGSAAAVIAGIVALVHTHPAGEAKSSTASSNAALATPATRPTPPVTAALHSVEFGDVSRPATLRAVLELRLTSHASYATVTTNGAVQGATGAQSIAGLAARQGAAALVGPQGLQGDEGIQGPVGPTGPAGPTPTGPSGAQGVTGPVGVTGIAGGTGIEGGIGPQGPSGAGGPAGIPDGLAAIGSLVANDELVPAAPQGVTGGNAPVNAQAPSPVPPAAASDVTKSAASSPTVSTAEQVCTTAVRDRAQVGSAPVLSGTGTDHHRPVVIAVFRRGPAYVAYVLEASDCAVLSQQTLP